MDSQADPQYTPMHQTAYPYPFTHPATRVGVFGWVPGAGGVNHFRVLEPLRVLAQHGNRTAHGRVLSNEVLAQVDTVLVHMLHGERDLEAWTDLARNESHRMVIDVDDAMWAPDWRQFRKHWTPDAIGRLYRAVQLAHVVTTPSPEIAAHLHRINPNVWVVPNTVPEWVIGHTPPARQAPTIGWQMSTSHAPDWTQPTIRQLLRFLNSHTEWHVHSYGHNLGALADQPGVSWSPWANDHTEFYSRFSLDIGIGPLRDTYFNRCKSALRAIEYMAFGIVPVLPDLPIYHGWIENGVNGRLIGKHETLSRVLAEVAPGPVRMEMARRAREKAAAWTTEATIGKWVQAWHSR